MSFSFTREDMQRIVAAIERDVRELSAGGMLRKGAVEQVDWALKQVGERLLRLEVGRKEDEK